MERWLATLKQRLRAIGRRPRDTGDAAEPQPAPAAGLRTELDPAAPTRMPRAAGSAAATQPPVSDARTKKATLSRAARRVLPENAPSLWGIVAGAATDAWGRPSSEPALVFGSATLTSLAPSPPSSSPIATPTAEPQTSTPSSRLDGASSLSPVQDEPAAPAIELLGPAVDLGARDRDGHYERPF